jgi:phosphoribosyl-ATP pyrophosphohydrolase
MESPLAKAVKPKIASKLAHLPGKGARKRLAAKAEYTPDPVASPGKGAKKRAVAKAVALATTTLATAKVPSKGVRKRRAAKTSPIGAEIKFDPEKRLKRAQAPKAQAQALSVRADPDVLNRLWSIIELRRTADPLVSHSARLLGRGVAKVAQKFGEEAVECLIEVVAGNRVAAIGESADVLYHLLVMWVEAGIRPEEVWVELEKREGASNLLDGPRGPLKRLMKSVELGTSKIP